MTRLPADDYRRMFRVLDMMLTAHSRLRDRYRRRGKWLLLAILILSIAATAIAFLSGERHVDVWVWSGRLQTVAGALTVVICGLSLIDLATQWGRRAWLHEYAARRLGELKLRFRGAKRVGDTWESDSVDLAAEYERTMDAIDEIPDKEFVAQKAHHRRKIAISQLLDEYPGVPAPLLRLILFQRHWKALRSGGDHLTDMGALHPASARLEVENAVKPGRDEGAQG